MLRPHANMFLHFLHLVSCTVLGLNILEGGVIVCNMGEIFPNVKIYHTFCFSLIP